MRTPTTSGLPVIGARPGALLSGGCRCTARGGRSQGRRVAVSAKALRGGVGLGGKRLYQRCQKRTSREGPYMPNRVVGCPPAMAWVDGRHDAGNLGKCGGGKRLITGPRDTRDTADRGSSGKHRLSTDANSRLGASTDNAPIARGPTPSLSPSLSSHNRHGYHDRHIAQCHVQRGDPKSQSGLTKIYESHALLTCMNCCCICCCCYGGVDREKNGKTIIQRASLSFPLTPAAKETPFSPI